MYVGFVGSTDWARQFDTITHGDAEYETDVNGRPRMVSLYLYEEHSRTGRCIWRDELERMTKPPYPTGGRDLFVAYAADAECQCFIAKGWQLPRNILDLYVENIVRINGRPDLWTRSKYEPNEGDGKQKKSGKEGRPGLLDVLDNFGFPADADYKKRMRDIIIAGRADEFREETEVYNRSDVAATIALGQIMGPGIDLDRALFRARFMAAAARMEHVGIPIDPALEEFVTNWDQLRLHYIKRGDTLQLYDGLSLCEDRLFALIDARGWDWPRTRTGRFELKKDTIGRQAQRYPELRPLAHLRDVVAELRLNKLANTIGADGYSRVSLLPFWTLTGRCQPSSRDGMYLPALPSWLHGLIRPKEGDVAFSLDWDGQEVAIAAGLSGDTNLIADYASGDVHTRAGIRTGLLPPDATKTTHRQMRDKLCKPMVFGSLYGQSAAGLARKTKMSLAWAQQTQGQQHQVYRRFFEWQDGVVLQAMMDGVIETDFGWRRGVLAGVGVNSLKNFLVQSSGAHAMQIAAIAATEAGVRIAAPVHDAFWVLAREGEEAETAAHMAEIMMKAGRAVAGIDIPTECGRFIYSGACLGDRREPNEKGYAMWHEVRGLIRQGIGRP